MTKPIIGRVGGKSRLAPWIIEHLSRFQWSLYCEPFAGSAAVYFRLIHEGILEGIKARGHHPRVVLNDADSRIVQLFQTCRDYPEALAHAIEFTPYSREEHRLAQTEDLNEVLDDVERSRRFLLETNQAFANKPQAACQGRKYAYWGCSTERDHPKDWASLPSRILEAARHLKLAYIEHDDAVAVIERWATPWTAIYADPPYVGLEDYYAHNASAGAVDSLDLHHRLAATLNTVEAAAVIVSYYPCELVDELYPEETWERHYRETVASSAGVTRLSKSKTRPKRQELLLVRKQKGTAPKVNLSGQMGLF